MTSSLFKRILLCANIIGLAILIGQPALAKQKTKTLGDLNCVEEGDIAVFSGGRWECESDVGLVDNGDGTVTDHDTGLMWEMKED